jgi:hypothetical protein
MTKLTGGERVLLEELVTVYPRAVARDELGETTEYARSSRNTYLQRLSARELIEAAQGMVRASPMLFD